MADYSEAKVEYDREDRLERSASASRKGRGESVSHNLGRVQDQIQQLDELIGLLEKTLEPVLRREYEGMNPGEDSEPTAASDQSLLSEQIESYADRLNRKNRHLSRILERINL
jgi:hypothetical protein